MQPIRTNEISLLTGSSLRAHFELMRPANMVTAVADVLAGFAVAGLVGAERLPWLLAAGLALYGGGVTLNDLFDRRLDAMERPERPLPSGRVSALSACLQGVGLLSFGIASAYHASAASGALAAVLAIFAVVYDAIFKHIPLAGPILMGSCRGLDLLLGVSANGDALAARWYMAAIPLAYISGVTLLSSGEVHGGTRLQAYFSTALLVLAALAAPLSGLPSLLRISVAALMLGLLAWRVAPAFYKVCLQPGPSEIRTAVKAGVICLVFLDASIAAASQSLLYALGMVALVFLVSRLACLFPVT